MSHSARSLKITIVSPDSSVLQELSWMLTAVGYAVVTSKDLGENAAWRQFGETDFVVFDGRSIADPSPATLEHCSDQPLYRIFLYDPKASIDLATWFAVGANDALRVPISRGELLSRIRTGARVLEFENRMRFQSSRSRLPGMYSRHGLLRKLCKFTSQGKSAAPGYTLLTTSIEFFTGFCRKEGESAATGLLTALATSIQQSVDDHSIAAYNDDGTFHILLPGRDVAAARVIAEQIAQKFREAQVDREPRTQLSVTTAIVPWEAGTGAEQLLEQGQEALAIAQHLGGDIVIDQNECLHSLSKWRTEITAGNPFANITAQDIMEPFPGVLECDLPNHAMLVALHRSGVQVLPFIDREGRLVGIGSSATATDADAVWGPSASGNKVLANPVTIPHNAAFAEILEAFTAQQGQTIVVVAGNRPVGYLTRSGFFSLIEPANSATYSSNEPVLEDSRGLLVGSPVNEPELASDADQSHFQLSLREPLDRSVHPAMQ